MAARARSITFANCFFDPGHAFRGHAVGLVPTPIDGVLAIHCHAHSSGQIDLRLPASKPKGNDDPLAKLDPSL